MNNIVKKEMRFNNLEELISLVYNNVENMQINKENLNDIYDLRRYVDFDTTYEHFMPYSYNSHNLLNKTYGKKNVPTIRQNGYIFNNIMYCPHCGKMHSEIDYSGTIAILDNKNHLRYRVKIENIDKFICLKCNSIYSLEDVKIIDGRIEHVYANVFIDEDKISLAYKYMYNSINKNGNFYYEDGYTKITFNTKKGYSYTTNKGYAYKSLKRTWERYEKTPPVMFNSTYTFADGAETIIHNIVDCNIIEEYKNMDKEDLLKIFTDNNKDEYKIVRQKQCELIKYISNELYNKVQQNFSYKIPEHIKQVYEEHPVDAIRFLKNFNRYVNIKPNEKIINILMDKAYNLKRNKIDREEINLINQLLKIDNIKLGKKTRALVQKNQYNQILFNFVPVLLCFKNIGNINKLINEVLANHTNRTLLFYSNDFADTIRLWLNFRDENYVTKKVIEIIKSIDKDKKVNLMRDSFYMIRRVQREVADFDVKEYIEFKNEKQFHDDLTKFVNSDEYQNLADKKQASIVFDLDKDIFNLENKDENIFIATNSLELKKIGRQMGICVGSYTDLVIKNRCKIAYIMDENNEEYKACLELKEIKTKNKIKYSLVQAKLKYNRLPCENMEIYNKIKKWTDSNSISIDTYDMELPELEKETLEYKICAM